MDRKRKAKQTYYYNKSSKELSRLEPGDVVCLKPETDSRRWTKAIVDKEVDMRSYKVHTEAGRTCVRNRRYLRLTWEPSSDFSANLHQHDQPIISPKLPDCTVPQPISVEIVDSPEVAQPAQDNQVSKSQIVVSVPASAASTPGPAVVTTRSGRAIKILRYDSAWKQVFVVVVVLNR